MIKKPSRIMRRLAPLYVGVFLQSFVLWYAIEKLFMTTIGFDSASIAVMATVYAATMLVIETPSGILADRWSRKGVLMLAGLFLAIASLIAGLSGDIFMYLVSAVCWGVFFALHSGTYDSIVYDTLLEEEGNVKKYEYYYGRLRALDGVGLVLGSLAGGLVGQFIGMREAYFITIPFALASIVFLWLLREPHLHKIQQHASVFKQIRSTFGHLLKTKFVILIGLAILVAGVVDQMIFEFDQLWLIALSTPIVAYGPVNALLLLTVSIGGIAAAYLSRRTSVAIGFALLMTILGLTLHYARSDIVIVIAMFLIVLLLMAYGIIFNKMLHDRLASNIRAGAMSAINTFSKLLFIPVALVFGFTAQATDVFDASWVVIIFVVAASCITVLTIRHANRIPPVHATELVADDMVTK